MPTNDEIDPEEVLRELLDLAAQRVPGDLGKCVGILHKALVDLQSHIDCATDDLQRLSSDFQAERHCLDCAMRDVARVRAELACIRAAAKVIRGAIYNTADVAQVALLIDPILRVLSGEQES